MTKYVALVRAVNVGGTGKLPMADLKAMCGAAGFTRVETYIASGNVVFESKASAARVKSDLERHLFDHAGKPVGVVVRTAPEMRAILKANPFPSAAPNRTYAIFLDEPPPHDALEHAIGANGENMQLGVREIYVHYPNGMGRSKLRIPAAKLGTARNLNTVAKLAEMTSSACPGKVGTGFPNRTCATLDAHVPEKWEPVFRTGHAPL
jgi:uncharacterized protein (DUF1697 family)